MVHFRRLKQWPERDCKQELQHNFDVVASWEAEIEMTRWWVHLHHLFSLQIWFDFWYLYQKQKQNFPLLCFFFNSSIFYQLIINRRILLVEFYRPCSLLYSPPRPLTSVQLFILTFWPWPLADTLGNHVILLLLLLFWLHLIRMSWPGTLSWVSSGMILRSRKEPRID